MCCTIGLVRAKAKIGTKNLAYKMRGSVSRVASTRARREKRSIKEANHATHHKKNDPEIGITSSDPKQKPDSVRIPTRFRRHYLLHGRENGQKSRRILCKR